MRAITILIFSLIVAFFVFGCLGLIGSSSQYSNYYLTQLNRSPIYNLTQIEQCKIGSCWCMVCANGSTFFSFLTSLVGGSCYIEKNCNQQTFGQITNGSLSPDLSIRHFMLGQGPTFADFGDANAYCSNRLSMAVQWLIGTNESPYERVDPSRSICFLDKGIIPVYILFSNGQNINLSRTREIARSLGNDGDDITLGRLTSGPVGPVIVTTEIDFNASQASQIKNQIVAINQECGNDRASSPQKIYCMVAVAPKMNDFDALNAVMSDPLIANQVDLVAYGINAHYLDLNRSCGNPGSAILEQARNFSSYALYNLSKPSIIPYIMFDTAGTDSSGACNWTETKFIDSYSVFFPGGVVSLQQKGVIGIAPYSFNSTAFGLNNPLGCIDCAIAKNGFRMRAWYGGCQAYTNITRLSPGGSSAHPSPGTLLVFPNESGGFCDYNSQLDFVFRGITFGDGLINRDFMNPQQPQLQQNVSTLIRCDACLSNKIGPAPFAFPSRSANLDRSCHAFPEIEFWASQRNMDPMLVRAFIVTESDFDPCSAARVCRAGYNGVGADGRACFDNDASTADECYGIAYNEINDPALNCSYANAPNSNTPTPDWRWCAFGLMQSLEPPFTFWPGTYTSDGNPGPFVDILNNAVARGMAPELSTAKACNPTGFNPFNATDSICIGTAKMASGLRSAKAKVTTYHQNGWLNWGANDIDKDNVFAAYIMANMYSGVWGIGSSRCGGGVRLGDCWVQQFYLSWTVNQTYCSPPGNASLPPECSSYGVPDQSRCYGYQDFIQYVRECEIKAEYGTTRIGDRGAGKIGVYYYLRDNCDNSFCPDWRQLDRATQWSTSNGGSHALPTSGSPYIPNPPGNGSNSSGGGPPPH